MAKHMFKRGKFFYSELCIKILFKNSGLHFLYKTSWTTSHSIIPIIMFNYDLDSYYKSPQKYKL